MSERSVPDDVNVGQLRDRIRTIEERLRFEIALELERLHGELGVSVDAVFVELTRVGEVGSTHERAIPTRVRIDVSIR